MELRPKDERGYILPGFRRSVEEAAAEPVRLALLAPDGPTGGFFENGWT
jgi:hypothetical protein